MAIGRNYVAHAQEHGADVPAYPLIFLKPPSAVIGPDAPIWLPPQSEQVEHESELAVVIGRDTRGVAAENALDYVFGYTCGNDVTARDLQRTDGQWSRAKGFDTFCPLGPWIETELDPGDLEVTCRVNGEVRQSGRTSQLVFDIPYLISYISHIMTLMPGDVIMSGTPAAVAINIFGDDLSILRSIAKEVEAELRDLPGARDVNAQREVMITTLPIKYRAADLARWGLTPVEAAEQVKAAVFGEKVALVNEGVRLYDIVVRLAPEHRATYDHVRGLLLRGAGGGAGSTQ